MVWKKKKLTAQQKNLPKNGCKAKKIDQNCLAAKKKKKINTKKGKDLIRYLKFFCSF